MAPTTPDKPADIHHLPPTTAERLDEAAQEYVDIKASHEHVASTVMYLAYGSNLCAETFQGMRGIRPLSQTNVSVPSLRLTFSLPGLPYKEPCFGNVDYRKLPEKSDLPDVIVPSPPATSEILGDTAAWTEGLIGVVYEVTQEDYSTIIRTEGGGAGYKEIAVPCIPLPPRAAAPEHAPASTNLPMPILARTLYAPQIPDDELASYEKSWWKKFFTFPQRPIGYAQPSARYLKLLTDGAKEHDLPDEYQRYLHSLQPYETTTRRQVIGKWLFFAAWGLPFSSLQILSKIFGDKNGITPKWLQTSLVVMFNCFWMSYDYIFRPLFGDGERTQRPDQIMKRVWRTSTGLRPSDSEQTPLLTKRQ